MFMRTRELVRLVLYCVVPPLAVLGLQVLCLIDLSVINEYHFDVITVNSIFAGFLFTSLSLVLGLGKDPVAMRLERMKALPAICNIIFTGIISSFVSIGCALINIFTNNRFSNEINIIQVSSLIVTTILFMWSVYYVKIMIGAIRKDIRKKIPSQDIVKQAIQKIQQTEDDGGFPNGNDH